MSKRLLILIFLAGSVLLIRGLQYYYVLTQDYVQEGELGYVSEIRNGHIHVKSVITKRYTNQYTATFLAGLKSGDEILAIYNAQGQGKEIKSYFDLGEVWKTIRYGEPWSILVLRDGKEVTLNVPPLPQPQKDFRNWFVYGLLLFKIPLLVLFIAFFLGFAKPEDDHAFQASIFFVSFSFVFGILIQYFPPVIRDFAVFFSVISLSMCGYLFSRFFLNFPAPSILDRKFPWLNKVLLMMAVVLTAANTFASYLYYSSFQKFELVYSFIDSPSPAFAIAQMLIIAVGLVSLILHFLKAETKDERRKTGILLTGAFIGVVPLSIFLSIYARNTASVPPLWVVVTVVISIALFPLSFLYVVLRHRVLGFRLIVRRGLQYALVSRGFFVIEGFLIFGVLYLLLAGLRVLHYTQFGLASIFLTAGAAFGTAIFLRQINQKAMGAIDRRFFRHAYNTQQVLTDLARAVRRLAAKREDLFALVTDKVSDALMIDRVAVFLRDPSSQTYRCQGLRVRSGYDDEVWYDPNQYRNFQFPPESLIEQQLSGLKNEAPECIEVYPKDPTSWASSLMKTNMAEPYNQERALIEKMNTKLIVPLMAGEEALGFLSLGEKLSEEAYTKEDKALLLSVGEQTAIALEYSNLIAQVAEQEKLQRELQIATEVQARLFPQIFPPMNTFEYTGYCKAARAVGGDYYDFLSLNDRSLGVALGDVSGKGISSALLMANLQALLRSSAPLRGDQIDQLMTDINRLLCASTTTHKYATFFYCVYDDDLRRLTYVNAGHNPPLLFRSNGTIEKLDIGGLVVGMLPDVVYQKDVVQLATGDILMIYSDGLTEAMNEEEAEFGEDRVIQQICQNRDLPVQQLCDRILNEVHAFVGDAPQHDDLTMVIARVL